MIIDKQNLFSADNGDTPTTVGSTASTNIVDLGVARDIGGAAINHLMLLCQVMTAFTSGGGATLQVQWQTAPDNGSGSPGSWVTLAQSDAVALGSLVPGYQFLPGPLTGPTQRFVRLNYVIGTAAMTGGAIYAGLTPAMDVQRSYPRGYTA